MKGVPEYENKSKDCDFWWLMEEPKKIMAGLDVKANLRMSIIEKLSHPSLCVKSHLKLMMITWTGSINDYKT